MELVMASFQDQISELSDQVFEKLNINTFPLVPVDASRREYEENKEYEIPVDLIFDNPCEIRKHMDTEELETLKNSIKATGQNSSIILTEATVGDKAKPELSEKRIYLISGQRRLRACRELGFKTIRARFIYSNLRNVCLEDNIARADIHYIDMAEYINKYHLTTKYLTETLHISKQTVSDYRTLMNLDEKIRNSIRQRHDIPKRDMLIIARKKEDKQMEAFNNYMEKKENKPMRQKKDPKSKAYYDINKLYMYLSNNSDLAQEDLTDVYEVAQKIVNLIEKYNENEYINFVNGNEESV